MADANVAIIKNIYDAFNEGDVHAVVNSLDPQIEWIVAKSLPFGGSYKGHDEVIGLFEQLGGYYPDLTVEPEDFLVAGDNVIVRGHHRGKTAVDSFEIPFAQFWTVRSQKVTRFQEYQDTAENLRVSGNRI